MATFPNPPGISNGTALLTLAFKISILGAQDTLNAL